MNREKNIESVINDLMAERGEKEQMPAGLYGRQRLLRALMNVRPPMPIGPRTLKAQDEELQAQLSEKGVVTLEDIPGGAIRLWQGDITRLKVDAIVNAANSQMLGCFIPLHSCIDNVIHSAAGIQLRLECERIMQGGELETGGAVITGGYNLPAKHVIHTVGPIIPSGVPTAEQEEQLASCYRNCLDKAAQTGCKSIAFCCISTGVFNFPQELAAEIAVRTVREWLSSHEGTSGMTVIFNVFKDEDHEIYRRLLGE